MKPITPGTLWRVYVLYTNDSTKYDFNLKRYDYSCDTKLLKAQYPSLTPHPKTPSNKYTHVWIGCADSTSSLESIRDSRRNTYMKYVRGKRKWNTWMSIYKELMPHGIVGIHELEVVGNDKLESSLVHWIEAYSQVIPEYNILNEMVEVPGVYKSPPQLPEKFPETAAAPPEEPRGTREIGIQCRPFRRARPPKVLPIGKKESQKKYREKNRELIRQKARRYHIPKEVKESVNMVTVLLGGLK